MPQHPADYVKLLISQRKIEDPEFTVEKMCDDLDIPFSTFNKFLNKTTQDTRWSNVSLAVSYLGGSLDQLAGIQAKAIKQELMPQINEAVQETTQKAIRAEYPALALLVESYEKEIHRNSDHHHSEMERVVSRHQSELDRINRQHEDYLNRFRRINEESRQIMLSQHAASVEHLVSAHADSLSEQRKHLDAAINGRNVWRRFAFVLLVVLFACAVYVTWEFSNLYGGLTGHLLRQAGLISAAGGAI